MNIEQLKQARANAINQTSSTKPRRIDNPFFGVGPITDMVTDEFDARMLRLEFDRWVEENYPKLDDNGKVIGHFTTRELGRGMHRGYPADKVLSDMMREIHRYFEFPMENRIAIGLGGGHSGYTVAALHLVNANDVDQQIFVDTLKPESEAAKKSGFFRQSWGAQLTEMLKYSRTGDPDRLYFSDTEGSIPDSKALQQQGIKLFFGVGHETTGATTYTEEQIRNLLAWIDLNPQAHHAVIDSTSMLGAMPWSAETVKEVMQKCCMFTPFQKAIGGISGYFLFSMTPAAENLINQNMQDPSWAIPRQLKIAVPSDAKLPLSSESTTTLGPVYDPEKQAMLGGIINTFSTLAFAETTFAVLHNEKSIGDIATLNQRSVNNRQLVSDWVERNQQFELGVKNPESRGAAVTLLKVVDNDIDDTELHERIIVNSKKMLGYDGLTHPNGDYEKGLDVARYVNAFPGTDGDYRAWIGGIRPQADIEALLENINYCYQRAKIVVMEEEMEKLGSGIDASKTSLSQEQRCDDPNKAYKVIIVDLIGMLFDKDGNPDHSAVQKHIESKGGVFHLGLDAAQSDLDTGNIHFFYQPDLSTEAELLVACGQGQFDAVIAAATFLPESCEFQFGGVRIGAGTGNMGCGCWGGGNGTGGIAPLMNTPSFNSRATAQTAMKALLKVMPDLQVQAMHERVVAGDFDTGKNLVEYPTSKLESKKIAVIGYGNIGREVAKLAQAFGMEVSVFARERHKQWIQSEGFTYAHSIAEAAQDADVISPHLGLGPLNANTGEFANANVIDAEVFAAMNHGAVLVNYDRGELVDIDALDGALSSGQISYAAIDADLFKNSESGELSGPMVPYLQIYPKHSDKLELLPHVAADTEHYSRVEGAKQAVDQIFDVIQYKRVVNLKGDLPKGYSNGNALTVNGVGAVTTNEFARLNAEELNELRSLSEHLGAFWGSLEAVDDEDRRAELIENHAAEATLNANKLIALYARLGLKGPYYG